MPSPRKPSSVKVLSAVARDELVYVVIKPTRSGRFFSIASCHQFKPITTFLPYRRQPHKRAWSFKLRRRPNL